MDTVYEGNGRQRTVSVCLLGPEACSFLAYGDADGREGNEPAGNIVRLDARC